MNDDEIEGRLELLRQLTGIVAQQTLIDLHIYIIRGTLRSKSYCEIAEAHNYGELHARGIGAELWRLLTRVLDEPVSKSNFRTVTEIPRLELRMQVLREQKGETSLPLNQPILESELIPAPLISELYENLPPPDYTKFVGREQKIDELLNHLSQPNTHRISIASTGGIGKTTLALEVARRCLQARRDSNVNHRLPIFDAFIFVSAKQQYFITNGSLLRMEVDDSLNDICQEIARVLRAIEIRDCLDLKSQIRLAKNKLERQSTLLIIDNLETVEDQEDILSFLYDLPSTVKFVITSRVQVPLGKSIFLDPLSQEESINLIQDQIDGTDISLVDSEIQRLYSITGGMPAAIIYAIGQLIAGYPLSSVLHQLNDPQGDINKYCFESSFRLIENHFAYYLLMALALFPAPATQSAIVEVAGLSTQNEFAIAEGFVQLRKLSLVSNRSDRYMISLPLTRNYIFGKLLDNPTFEQEARERWISWYLRLSCRQVNDSDWHR